MKCPSCGSKKTKVLDSRRKDDGKIHRRRQCCRCQHRFNTVEEVQVSDFAFIGSGI